MRIQEKPRRSKAKDAASGMPPIRRDVLAKFADVINLHVKKEWESALV